MPTDWPLTTNSIVMISFKLSFPDSLLDRVVVVFPVGIIHVLKLDVGLSGHVIDRAVQRDEALHELVDLVGLGLLPPCTDNEYKMRLGWLVGWLGRPPT